MSNDFYRAFEERYYASREVIIKLREQYLPFVQPLSVLHFGASTFDIGCGRGEWLELMSKIGFKPYGVDLDDGMLSDCIKLNLPAHQGDAVSYLASLADESQAIVTAFHVVEHIEFNQLINVVTEALRVLKPGGLLIMETPNPENIRVATTNFYLDPTHLKPIPPQLLAFLPEHYGFCRTKVIRLQESEVLAANPSPTLWDVLTGVSPDYAVIAQKIAPEDILILFDATFTIEHGLSLDTLADRFDTRVQHAELKAQQTENALNAIYNSRSWRITQPLRWLTRLIAGLNRRIMR
jgi:SAM-dependent methyltransferase